MAPGRLYDAHLLRWNSRPGWPDTGTARTEGLAAANRVTGVRQGWGEGAAGRSEAEQLRFAAHQVRGHRRKAWLRGAERNAAIAGTGASVCRPGLERDRFTGYRH